MVTLLKWAGIVLVSLIVLFFVVGLFLPREYTVERSVVIAAEPEQIHRLVGDLKQWPEWSPWEELDPSIKTTYGAQTSGVGASQSWDSDSGNGHLTLTTSDDQRGVVYDLAFDQDKYRSVGSITYEAVRDGTQVTWIMSGDSGGIIGRYFGLMMDSMVGPPFESGLDKLKTKAEELAAAEPEPTPEPPAEEQEEPEPA